MVESAACRILSSFMHAMPAATILLITIGSSFLCAFPGSSGVVAATACVGRRDQSVLRSDKIGLKNSCASLQYRSKAKFLRMSDLALQLARIQQRTMKNLTSVKRLLKFLVD